MIQASVFRDDVMMGMPPLHQAAEFTDEAKVPKLKNRVKQRVRRPIIILATYERWPKMPNEATTTRTRTLLGNGFVNGNNARA